VRPTALNRSTINAIRWFSSGLKADLAGVSVLDTDGAKEVAATDGPRRFHVSRRRYFNHVKIGE
jgi:hypothetical protein